MTMRRRVLVSLGLLALVLLAGAAVLLLAPRDPLAIAAAQICEGMTEQEVVATVGRPPDMPGFVRPMTNWRGTPGGGLWVSERHWLSVSVDAEGRVVSISLRPAGAPTLLERVRGWLGITP